MTATLERRSSLDCSPRWTTPRNHTRATRGGEVARLAQALGTPLMPWQRHVVDVALEVDPETGLLAYGEVDLTVPRQSGKTTLLLAVMVHRALAFDGRQQIVYTAQSRNAARKKWEDEHVRQLEASPLKAMFRVRRQYGAEAIRWKNGSMHGITAPTETAGHGEVLDLGVVDEAFAQEDSRLEQAFKPAMITRPQPQLWPVSTAGTARSVYLRRKVETGRLRVDARVDSSVAYFEWSAPNDADPADPATWWACMPALGHTVAEDRVRSDFETMDLGEFRRAYCNQWQGEIPDEWQVIGRAAWQACEDPHSAVGDLVAFGADVTPDRSFGSVAVAGSRADGLGHVEVVEHRPGTGWMVARVKELTARWRSCAVVVDGAGPAGSLIAPLEAAGVEVAAPTGRDVTQGCGALYDAVAQGGLRHLGQPELASALAGAAKRPLGDSWAWARKGVSVDISPLVAVTLARWGFATRAHLVRAPAEPFSFWGK